MYFNFFRSYFDGCCYFEVPGRLFPVDEHHLEDLLCLLEDNNSFAKPFSEDNTQFDQVIEVAFRTGDFSDLKHMILHGNFPINYQHSNTGVTALMASAGHGNTEMIEILLRKNANISLTAGKLGLSAYQFAQSQNQAEICQLINDKSTKILENYHKNFNDEMIDFKLLRKLVQKLHQEQPLDHSILVFLPGYDEIVNLKDDLERIQGLKVCMLHSQLASKEQRKAFQRFPTLRKVSFWYFLSSSQCSKGALSCQSN